MSELFTFNHEIVREIRKQYLVELQEKLDNLNEESFPYERTTLESLINLSVESIEQIIKIAYFSCLAKEESRFHHFELNVSPPFPNDFFDDSFSEVFKPFVFSVPPKLSLLPKLAPALEFTDKSINIWFDENNEPIIWGFGEALMSYDCIKIKTIEFGKIGIFLPTNFNFSNNLVLVSLEKTEFLNTTSCFAEVLRQNEDIEDLRKIIKAIHGEAELGEHNQEKISRQFYRLTEKSKIFEKLAIKMKQHSHGGTLLVLFNSDGWQNSIQHPIPFIASSSFGLIRQRFLDKEEDFIKSVQDKNRSIFNAFPPPPIDNDLQIISQVTAVDGATVISKDFDLIAFGTKIKPINSDNKPEEITITEPFENSEELSRSISDLGGTRHQSAAQFVYDQKDSFAIVASQDGKVSIMYWDKSIEKVRLIQHVEYLFL